jgi:hypothetical protein
VTTVIHARTDNGGLLDVPNDASEEEIREALARRNRGGLTDSRGSGPHRRP